MKYNSIFGNDHNEKENIEEKSELLEDLDSLPRLNTVKQKRNQEFKMRNPIITKEFDKVIKIYVNPFEIELIGDNLTLKSKTTIFKAKKDRSIDAMFKGL